MTYRDLQPYPALLPSLTKDAQDTQRRSLRVAASQCRGVAARPRPTKATARPAPNSLRPRTEEALDPLRPLDPGRP